MSGRLIAIWCFNCLFGVELHFCDGLGAQRRVYCVCMQGMREAGEGVLPRRFC